MFKKALALCIALMMLTGMATAMAVPEKYRLIEDFSEFDVEVEIPEGALYKQNPREGSLCLEIWFEDPSKPAFDINIAFSEEVDSKFLADFTQEEIDHLLIKVGENFSMPTHEFFDTPSGNTILFMRETDPEAGDYATMITVYKGFFFSLYCAHADYSELTEEDLAIMDQIIVGAWIYDSAA